MQEIQRAKPNQDLYNHSSVNMDLSVPKRPSTAPSTLPRSKPSLTYQQSPKRSSEVDPFANLPKVLFSSPPLAPRTPVFCKEKTTANPQPNNWNENNPPPHGKENMVRIKV